MRKTQFAGLTVIETDLGDSIYSDDGSFLDRNPDITDQLLRVGALSHHHDGRPPLTAPTDAPTVTVGSSGGSLPGATTLYIAYTALDADGGETTMSPAATAVTPPPLAAPAAPTGVADYTAGTLRPGVYRYAISATDDRGGETQIGTPVELVLAYGNTNGQIALSGLAALFAAVGGTGWRLYRSIDSGAWAYITYGTADAITDDNTLCADCSALPPSVNSTNRTGVVNVTVAPALPAGSARYRIYASQTPAFSTPSLVGDYPADDLTEKTITDTVFANGAPPAVPTSVGGAEQIDPETDLADFHWLRPVPTAAALPAGEQGDVRLTLDTNDLYAHDGTGWVGPINANPSVTIGADFTDDVDELELVAGTGIGLTLAGTPGHAIVTVVNTAASSGADAGVRTSANVTTAALAPGIAADADLVMAKTFALLTLATDKPARVRLYSSPAKRDADAARPASQSPTGDSGLICEFITTVGALSYGLSPMTIGADLKAIPDGVIAARIENRAAAAGTVTVTVTHVPIEA